MALTGTAKIGVYALAVPPRGDLVAYLAFGPRDEGLVAITDSGFLMAFEWCPFGHDYIENAGRDGGIPMPQGHWESARLPGVLRRLSRAEIEREGFGPVAVQAFSDRLASGEPSGAPKGQRWARFSPRAQGRTFRLRIAVDEATEGVRAIDAVFDPLQGPGR